MSPSVIGMIVTFVVGALCLFLHCRLVAEYRRIREERYQVRIRAIEEEVRRVQEQRRREQIRPALRVIKGTKP